MNALSLGMAAIAAGDAEEARKQAKRAEKLLDDPSKTRLLSAQAAALGGDREAAGRYFDALTESPETRFVGLVGKLRQALEADDRDEALPLALRARDLRPDSGFVARTLFTLETGAADWDGAQKTLFDAVRRDLIPEAEAKRYRMAIDMERARLKQEAGDLADAADFARGKVCAQQEAEAHSETDGRKVRRPDRTPGYCRGGYRGRALGRGAHGT